LKIGQQNQFGLKSGQQNQLGLKIGQQNQFGTKIKINLELQEILNANQD